MRKDSSKYYSSKQEKKVAKELKGKTVVASGALWGSKGDVRSNEYLVECKTTSKSFYSLTKNVWDKIEKEAIKDGLRTPVMCIDLELGKYRVAVFRFNRIDLPPMCLNDITTSHKSFNICWGVCYSLLHFKSDCSKKLTLVVIPWNEFILLVE